MNRRSAATLAALLIAGAGIGLELVASPAPVCAAEPPLSFVEDIYPIFVGRA